MNFVCGAPCDLVIDGRPGQRFTLEGEFPTSSAFPLHEKSGDVTLKVEPGSKGLRAGGVAATIVGALGMTIGGVMLLSGSLAVDPNGGNGGTDPMVAEGAVTAGVGTAVLIAGIIMIVNGRTGYEFSSGAGAGDSGPVAAGRTAGWAVRF